MPTDSRAVIPSNGSASSSPKIIVPPTKSPMNSMSALVTSSLSSAPLASSYVPLAFRLEADGFKVLLRHETIRRAGIHQKKPFPSAIRRGRVANRYSDVRCSHGKVLSFSLFPTAG